MASLRARLVTGVVALAAVGMLLVGAITYVTQRNALVDRVDQQLQASVQQFNHRFGYDGDGGPDFGGPPGGPTRRAVGSVRWQRAGSP